MSTTKRYPRSVQPARAILKESGSSGFALSKKYGITPSQVSEVLAGRLTPSKRIVDAVTAETGLLPEDLFDIELLLHTRWYPDVLAERLRTQGATVPFPGGGRDE